MEVNRVSILRKEVVTNIPMFDDDETGNPQTNWVKLYDLDCVDYCPGVTAKVYNLEHDPNYSNNDTTFYIEFHFVSDFQTVKPPYDILEGDYVGCKQQGVVQLYRIVKTISTPIFNNCCDYQLICNVTTPREAERLMSCGVLEALKEEDYENRQTTFDYGTEGEGEGMLEEDSGSTGSDDGGEGADGETENGEFRGANQATEGLGDYL